MAFEDDHPIDNENNNSKTTPAIINQPISFSSSPVHQKTSALRKVEIAQENTEQLNESASVDSFAGFQSYKNNQNSIFSSGKKPSVDTLDEEEHPAADLASNRLSSTSSSKRDERHLIEDTDNLNDSKTSSSYLSSFLKITGSNPVSMLARQAAAFAVPNHLESALQAELNQDGSSAVTDQDDDDEEAFILATLDERSAHSRQVTTDPLQEQKSSSWFNELQSGFKIARDSFLGAVTNEKSEGQTTDWDFWGKVINDYEGMIRSHPRQFQKNLRKGLPEPIRGMMWQLMSNSKNEMLEEEFLALLQRSSRNEKIIIRDLARTFPGHEYFKDPKGPGQTSLFNILKAYSLYDQEIGYCQGLPFVVGPLILNMPEEQAFCVLVKLMFDYDFRDLYTPKMIGLQLRNHQFDRLLAEQFPVVFKHMENQDIKSTMYASQWFMTLFAYRFPLDLVYRIMDVILAEGAEAVLRFALALIKRNAEKICTLDFEPLLEYLKDGLFDTYIGNMDQFVVDAATITISKRKLNRWSAEYLDLIRQQSPEVLEAQAVKKENRRLASTHKSLENNYEILNREHIDLVNKYIEERSKYEHEKEQNEDLNEQIGSLKAIIANDRSYAEDQVKQEMDMLAQKNLQLTQINTMLEDTITELEQKLVAARSTIAGSENEKEDLRVKLHRLMRQNKL